MKISFDVDDDKFVTQGVFISEYIDSDGARGLQFAEYGSPALWARLGVLEAAVDRTRAQLRARWEIRE